MNNLRICPKCGTRSEVYAEHYNRASENYVRHSRCPKCGESMTTYELSKEAYFMPGGDADWDKYYRPIEDLSEEELNQLEEQIKEIKARKNRL